MAIGSTVRTLAIVFAGLAITSASPAGALSEDAAWGTVPSPNNGNQSNELAGLTVLGAADAWAVGRYNSGRPPTVTGRDTLALHWDGSRWMVTPTPNPTWAGADLFTLEGAAGLAANDVWAVGYAEDFSSLKSTTLVERWNGSRWTIVRSPNPAGDEYPNRLWSVDGAGPTDVWAVGGAGYPERSLILRWDGTAWRTVRNRCGTELQAIGVLTASDIWAVGASVTCHYDGSSWRVVPSPQPRPAYNELAYVLNGVSAARPDDVWVTGARVLQMGEYVSYESIAEHWNGSAWTLDTTPPGQSLNGVRALSPTDVWAVGTDGVRGVVAHFDGRGWSLVPSPTPGDSGSLVAVDAESSAHLWAVGTAMAKTLVLESPSRFEGTVIGDTNVAGATVSWFGPESGSTETDSFGNYAIVGLTAGHYHLIGTNPGCSPATKDVVVTAGTTVHQDLKIGC